MDCPAMIRFSVALYVALFTFSASATEPVIVPRATAGTFDRVVWQGPDGFARQIGRTDRLYFEPFGDGSKARSTTTAMTVAGDLNLHRTRNMTAQAIAKAGRIAARASGPGLLILAGLELADLYFDSETQEWTVEQPPDVFHTTSPSGVSSTAHTSCTYNRPGQIVIWSNGYETTGYHPGAASGGAVPPGWESVNNCDVRVHPSYGSEAIARFGGVLRRPFAPCPDGSMNRNMHGVCTGPQFGPASDADIEDAIYVELVARGMASELARRLIGAGYVPDMGPLEVDGPTSLIGPTQTSTTTGPSGTTTTTKQTNYDLGYSGDTVTVTPTTTTTTTDPSGTTTTTTSTSGGGSSEVPPEPLGLCDEYPNISACQELGETQDEDLQEEERDLDFEYSDVSGSCPPPQVISTSFGSYAIPFDAFCTYASGMRPIVILSFLLSAGLFLFYIVRRT